MGAGVLLPPTHSLDPTLFVGKDQTHLSHPRVIIDKNGDFFFLHSTTDNFFYFFLLKKKDPDRSVFFPTILLNRGSKVEMTASFRNNNFVELHCSSELYSVLGSCWMYWKCGGEMYQIKLFNLHDRNYPGSKML